MSGGLRGEFARNPEVPVVLQDRIRAELDPVLGVLGRALSEGCGPEEGEKDRMTGDHDRTPPVPAPERGQEPEDPVRRVVEGLPVVVLVVEVLPAPPLPLDVRLLRDVLVRRGPFFQIVREMDRSPLYRREDARGLDGTGERAAVDEVRLRMLPLERKGMDLLSSAVREDGIVELRDGRAVDLPMPNQEKGRWVNHRRPPR